MIIAMNTRSFAQYAMLIGLLFCSTGCLDLTYAQMHYHGRKQDIRKSHASISVSGIVVGPSGKPSSQPWRIPRGFVTMTGLRDITRFSMKGEGAGDSTELICKSAWFIDERFSIKLNNVREATLTFTRKGYQPATLHVTVPKGEAAPMPVVITDALVTMHLEE